MAPTSSFSRFRSLFIENPSFGILTLSRFAGTISFQIQSVAVAWQVYELTRSPVYLGYVGLAQFVPMMVLTLVAGDVADRIDKRVILALTSAGQALAAGLFIALTLSHAGSIWPFYLVLALFGSARAFSGPAQQSLLPLLVTREQFGQAIGVNSSIFQTAVIVGPALGGALYTLGPLATYGVCLAISVAVGFSFGYIRPRSMGKVAATNAGATTMVTRVAEGIAFVRAQPIVLGAISLDLFAVLLGGATALLPIFAHDILHAGPAGLGVLRSAPAIGAALTAVALSLTPLRRHAGPAMFGSVVLFGLATIVFGLSTNLLLSFAALLVLGASDMISVYVRSTLIQLATPDAMRGRVSAVNMLFIGASNELGEFESGITARWFGTIPAVVIGGAGTLAVVALWMWWFPPLRKADRLSDVYPAKVGEPVS